MNGFPILTRVKHKDGGTVSALELCWILFSHSPISQAIPAKAAKRRITARRLGSLHCASSTNFHKGSVIRI